MQPQGYSLLAVLQVLNIGILCLSYLHSNTVVCCRNGNDKRRSDQHCDHVAGLPNHHPRGREGGGGKFKTA